MQGVLIGRVILYWCCAMAHLGLGVAFFQYYEHPEWSIGEHVGELLGQVGPWLPSVFLILPLVIFDVVRLSNLFVGPIYRLRQHLNELQEDKDCQPLKFREDDYWQDLADPINSLQAEILELRNELARHHDQASGPEHATPDEDTISIGERSNESASADGTAIESESATETDSPENSEGDSPDSKVPGSVTQPEAPTALPALETGVDASTATTTAS